MRFRVVLFILVCIAASVMTAQNTQRILDTSESTAIASPPQVMGNDPTNVDLLSLFRAAFQSYAESGGQAVTFSYKFPSFGTSLAAKGQLVLRQPKLDAKFAAALSAQPDRVASLERDLNFDDDVSFVLTIGPTASKSEKQIEQAFQTAYETLYNNVQGDSAGATTNRARAIRERAPALGAVTAIPAMESILKANAQRVAASQPFEKFDAILQPGDLRNADALAQFRTATPGVAVSLEQMERIAAAGELIREIAKDMAVVSANQSKFTLNASYRDRNEFAGPDEWMVKTGYEWGVGTNVAKRLENDDKKNCAQSYRAMQIAPDCEPAYAKVLKDTSEDGNVKAGLRFAFALEYKEFSKVALTQPVTFELKGSRSLIASLSGGLDLLQNNDLPARGRLELSIAYDDVRDDNDPSKNRKDRLIGKLTYSQRITEKVNLPITLTYANHADYLTDVDRKLNAHFGITYSFPDLTKK